MEVTLKLQPNTLQIAMQMAEQRGKNLSDLVEELVIDANTNAVPVKESSAEIVKRLRGSFKGAIPEGKTYDDVKWEYLKEKYNL